ncbi:MAG: biotin carboxylase N-terminal domain-containing protein [Polyangiales bacterium]
MTRLLVWNRGEIALRACLAARRLGVPTVLFLTPADVETPAARVADALHLHGASEASRSFNDLDVLRATIAATGATHVYPGYGFLSESASLARAVAEAGAVFVGPPAEVLEEMAHKVTAKALARDAGLADLGIPLEPDGAGGFVRPPAEAFPLLLKASAGGGGRGNLVVERPEGFDEAVAKLRRRAKELFSDDSLLAERYLVHARHVELQVFGVLGDGVRILDSRDCSLQRNHQKVIEEGPASDAALALLEPVYGALAAALARRGYRNAGTIELLHAPDEGRIYFLEMNPRIQVEHPVTELRLGIDLVEWQLREALGIRREELMMHPLAPRGHAIQARLYAEDPANGFAPDAGLVHHLDLPSMPFVRWDLAVREGASIAPHYDPMIAKLIVQGHDRADALSRLAHALDHAHVHGVRTNLDLLRALAAHPPFAGDVHDTRTLEKDLGALTEESTPPGFAAESLLVEDLHEPTRTTGHPGGGLRWKLAHRS